MLLLLVELGQLFFDLGPRAGDVGPVEAGAGGPPLQLGGAFQGGKRQGNTGQSAGIERFLSFLGLQFFPTWAVLGIAEDMRVAALELVGDAAHDVVEREMAGFSRHLRVEYDLELEIAELVGQRVHVAAIDGVGDLIGFLDGVGRDGREILLAIPFAAGLGVAQPPHDRNEPL